MVYLCSVTVTIRTDLLRRYIGAVFCLQILFRAKAVILYQNPVGGLGFDANPRILPERIAENFDIFMHRARMAAVFGQN